MDTSGSHTNCGGKVNETNLEVNSAFVRMVVDATKIPGVPLISLNVNKVTIRFVEVDSGEERAA